MTTRKHDHKKDLEPPTGVNDDPVPASDDRAQHEDETLGDLLGNRDPESTSRSKDKPAP